MEENEDKIKDLAANKLVPADDEASDKLAEKKEEITKILSADEVKEEILFPAEVPSEKVSSDTIAVTDIKKDIINKPSHSSPKKKEASRKESVEEARKARKKKIIRRVVLGIVAGILGLCIGAFSVIMWYKNHLLNQITYITTDATYVPTIIDESGNTVALESVLTEATQFEAIEEEHIHNFLLIGIDSRSTRYNESGTGALADVIMVMSVDNEAGTIKMISVARDDYAYVPGYSRPMKINAAMSYGGPELLQATVERSLRINIDGYAFVNFYNMAGVIDAVGGVYCDVTGAELYGDGGLNMCLDELGYGDQHVDQTGYIWLNGRQAVAYARIRKIDTDYKRSERQVEVLRSLLSQFLNLSLTGKMAAMDDILGMISTNISPDEITDYAIEFLPSLRNVEIQYLQLPIQGCFNSGMYGGEWSIRPNWNAEIPYVQEFFYGEVTEFDPVEDIPSSPALENCPTDLVIEDLLR
ncbi:MAG: LCP family protein [Clostridiales bacterium]|nr:LCP family protein [Clostridiales bacterium]